MKANGETTHTRSCITTTPTRRCSFLFAAPATITDFAADSGAAAVIETSSGTVRITLEGHSTFAADISYDGIVNYGDLGPFQTNFLKTSQSPGWDPTADINGDGIVNYTDLGTFNQQFLLSRPPVE